jgi:hypothetical protein
MKVAEMTPQFTNFAGYSSSFDRWTKTISTTTDTVVLYYQAVPDPEISFSYPRIQSHPLPSHLDRSTGSYPDIAHIMLFQSTLGMQITREI